MPIMIIQAPTMTEDPKATIQGPIAPNPLGVVRSTAAPMIMVAIPIPTTPSRAEIGVIIILRANRTADINKEGESSGIDIIMN